MKNTLTLLLLCVTMLSQAQQNQFNTIDSLIRSGKLTEAETLLKITQGSRAQLKTHYGLLYMNQSRYDLALESLQGALSEFENTNQANTLEAAETLIHLGNVYRATGKYSQAEEQLNHALIIREEKLPAMHELIAAVYNDLGLVYTQLDTDKSIAFYEKALETYQKIHGKNHPKLAIANTNLGVVYYKEKLYGDAINYYETALKIWTNVYTKPHANKALVLMNLGQTYSAMGDAKAALEFYEKSRAEYETALGVKHPDVAYIQNLLGNEKLVQKKFDESLTHYQKALQANIPNFTDDNTRTTPPITDFYNGTQLLYSLMYKARALESQHFGKTLNPSDLTLALTTLQACDSLIDNLRQQSTNESDKLTLGVIANDIYADGVRIAYALSEVAFTKRNNYRALSFYFAEKSKSAVLQDAISDTNAKSYANIPNSLLEEEKNLKASIALINQKLAQKPEAEEEKYLRETNFNLNRTYQNFIQQLENQYPEYFNLKYNSAAPSIEQFQKVLTSNTALLSYFIDENNSRLYTYIITKKKFRIISKALPKEYNKYITGLRNSILFQEINAFKKTAFALHDVLVPKMPGSINDLVIIPTGRMGTVPFEALLTRKSDDTAYTYSSFHYLINKFSVRYEFSAGLALQKKQTNNAFTSALFCAPVTFSKQSGLNDLPGTELEVNTISDIFKQKNISSLIYLNKEATETNVKSDDLTKYSLLHFATHGVVDEDSPELSHIYLQTNTDAEDGNLHAGEIYTLQLNANLVTLSACQTGLGKISKGEGIIGLSRALVYAGAKNVMVSYWSVADESTAQLMTSFYTHLVNNTRANYSRDLRQAKLNLLNGKYAAPFYWAPFILIGF